MTLIKSANKSKIIITSRNGGEKLRGFTADYIFWPDMEVVDNPPECAKLIDENFDDLLL